MSRSNTLSAESIRQVRITCLFDEQFSVLTKSKTFERVSRKSSEDITGKPLSDYLDILPTDQSILFNLDRSAQSDTTFRFTAAINDGSTLKQYYRWTATIERHKEQAQSTFAWKGEK